MRALGAARAQLTNFGPRRDDGEGAEHLRPQGLTITAALPPFQEFTTLTSSELAVRSSLLAGSSCACLLALLCTFLLAKKRASSYSTDLWQFALSKPVRYCMILDHWFSYAAAIAIPYVAYRQGSIDRRTGMPWEYDVAYGACLLLHGTHELFWFSQMGDAAKRVSNASVVLSALLGILTLATYELDLQFAFVAYEADSKLAYASAGVFVLSNLIMELLGFTALTLKGARPEETFKPRGMEVLHNVLLAHTLEISSSAPTAPDTTGINQFGFVLLRVFLEDMVQAVLQLMFLLWFGFSPLVFTSVALSVAMAAHGLLAAPQEVLSWNRSRRASGTQ